MHTHSYTYTHTCTYVCMYLGYRMQLERCLSDDGKSTFRADEQSGEVIASTGLPSTRSCLHNHSFIYLTIIIKYAIIHLNLAKVSI